MKRINFLIAVLIGLSATSVMPMWFGQNYYNNNNYNYGYQDQGQECNILCGGEMKRPNELTRLNCHHRHCTECLTDTVERAIRDRRLGALRCPLANCGRQLQAYEVQRLLNGNQELIRQYNQIQEQQRIARDPNARHCPTPDCNHIYIFNPREGRRLNFECPECHQMYCSDCLGRHDGAARCLPRARNGFDAVRGNPNFRACPQCQRPIERTEGCNYMRCRQENGGCGHEFCWACLVPDPGHRHVQCLQRDLDRARQLYGNVAGVPNEDGNPFGFDNRAEANRGGVRINLAPMQEPVYARMPQDPVRWPYYVLGGAIIAGAGYAAYKLYKYLTAPQEVPVKDLNTSLNDLLAVALRYRHMMQKNEYDTAYLGGSFETYFNQENEKQRYEELSDANIIELKRLNIAFANALAAGNCDKELGELVIFINKCKADENTQPVEPIVEQPSFDGASADAKAMADGRDKYSAAEVPAKTVPVKKPAFSKNRQFKKTSLKKRHTKKNNG